MNLLVLFLYPLLVLISCKTYSSNKPEEYLQVRRTSYRIVNNEAIVVLSVSDNVWYQDSVGITQLSGIKSKQYGSKDTLFPVTLGYRFVDMRRKWVYEYRNLSDTAVVVQKYEKTDSVQLAGGWNFFRKGVIQFDSLRAVGDASIGGVIYLKHRFVQSLQGRKILSEVLSRCDKKGSIFLLDTKVSEAIGCPVVKGTSFTPDGRLPTQSVEIEFISNEFPDSVRRVLIAWKQNVQKYPVE